MKSMLIIDTPQSCITCIAQFGGICNASQDGSIDPIVAETVDELFEKGGKPDWCPLRPLPEKQTLGHSIEYIDGYNACLDEITGETE